MSIFTDKAPQIMEDLRTEFDLTVEDAGAILGNLGHESGGFKFLQELKPLVPGSRGGYGWAQWTGPRRRAFEAWCKRKRLEPSSDEANFGYLVHELKTTEKKAIPALKAADTLFNKVVAFERAFERAGVKHYDKRLKYAKLAIKAYNETEWVHDEETEDPNPLPPPKNIWTKSKTILGGIGQWFTAQMINLGAFFEKLSDTKFLIMFLGVAVIISIFTYFIIKGRMDVNRITGV